MTQWMSATNSRVGRARKVSKSSRSGSVTRPPTVNSQEAASTRRHRAGVQHREAFGQVLARGQAALAGPAGFGRAHSVTSG